MDIIHFLMKFLNIPYKWGGKAPIDGLDCSGFVSIYLKAINILSYHSDLSAQGIHDTLAHFGTTREEARLGDIVFYGTNVKDITHVCVCLSDMLMIGACGGDKTTYDLDDAITQHAYVKVLPIDYRSDRVAIITPKLVH